MPDIISYLMGIITGVIPVIIVEEYRLWRVRKIRYHEREERSVSKLKVELKRFCNAWKNFKDVKEMHHDPGLTNFKYDLEYISQAIESAALASEGFLSKDVIDKALIISKELLALSKKEFSLDGGKSWREFLELGDDILKSCQSLLHMLS